jgi:hypothetical protein
MTDFARIFPTDHQASTGSRWVTAAKPGPQASRPLLARSSARRDEGQAINAGQTHYSTEGPQGHPTKSTLASCLTVHGVPDRVRLRWFDTQAEAEAAFAKALERGERAFIQPPASAWAGKGPRLVAEGRRLMPTKTAADLLELMRANRVVQNKRRG